MSNNELIYLPVSLGEAIDKLTILDIKLDKIKEDHRRNDVQKEYELLYEKLKEFLTKYNDLYLSMKKVNLMIWDMMDILRDGCISNEEYLKVCKECVEYNDIRFRVKNKINYTSNSLLKEQKSYKVNRLVIEVANNISNMEEFVRPIRYYSFFYDEIVIRHCENSQLKDIFYYDPTIIFIENEDGLNYKENSKKHFVFKNDFYDKEQINSVFELTEDAINAIL
uniref:Uncharacterized protein n=1 Tax=viral metagenome TaxID=1070528 RepID=A0A6C0B034_9ZZZZ